MFGENLKSSLGVLPWLLLPIACYVLFISGINMYYIQEYGYAERVVGGRWGEHAEQSALFSLVLALGVHIVLLFVVPAAIRPFDPQSKQFQFFTGFFTNLAISMIVPVYLKVAYGLDGGTFGILIVLDLISFLVTFIVGSRFVSPAYRKAFWFTTNG